MYRLQSYLSRMPGVTFIEALEKEVQELKGTKMASSGFEEPYSSLLESSPYPIAVVNQKGLTTYLNSVFEPNQLCGL